MVLELAPENEELSTDFETVFGRWRTALARRFETWAIAPGRAIGLADLVMSAFEGALILSRAARSTESFKTTVQAIAEVIDNEPHRPADHPLPLRPAATHAPGNQQLWYGVGPGCGSNLPPPGGKRPAPARRAASGNTPPA